MKYFKFFLIGIFFGIILSKSEVVSWYRIFEMFRFESFHMYGVIGSAVVVGAISLIVIKKLGLRNHFGEPISPPVKKGGFIRFLLGGSIFGLGWALTGACPGPMFVLVGKGLSVFLVVIASATLGTFVYGLLKDKLPH